MSVTPTRLYGLHDKLCEVLEAYLNAEYVTTDKDGNVHKAPPPANVLEVCRKFLADNGIEGVPVEGSPLGKLAERLPFKEGVKALEPPTHLQEVLDEQEGG